MRPSSDYFEVLERMSLGLAIIRLEVRLLRLRLAWKAGFRSDQPRIPRGRAGGGRWTEEGGGGTSLQAGSGLPAAGRSIGSGANTGTGGTETAPAGRARVGHLTVDDAVFGGGDAAEVILVQAGPRSSGGGRTRVGGNYPNATLRQQTELAMSQAAADAAVARVRERQPNWRPTPSLHESIQGAINSNYAIVRQAEARLEELMRMGIGPGPYAAGSAPARGPGRNFTAAEREAIQGLGEKFGCHTCGRLDPLTTRRKFVADHQLPSAINPEGRAQILLPQCATCSQRQGGLSSIYCQYSGGNGDMTIKTVICEPSNCILFVLDAAGGRIPEYVPHVSVLSTDSAIMIGCQSFMDGPTRVTLGRDPEVDPGRPPVHDQMLSTPKRLVRVETVEDAVVEYPVAAVTTRVRIWTNRGWLPDDIVIGLS